MRNIEIFSCKKSAMDLTGVIDVIFFNFEVYSIKGNEIWYNKEKTNTIIGECSELITPLQYLIADNVVFYSTSDSVAFINVKNNKITTFPFDSKIVATAWNPAEDVLVIIFEDGDVALSTFNVREETFDFKSCSNLNCNCPESISVGWGSTKTQFRGPLRKKSEDVLTLISKVLITNEIEIEKLSESDKRCPIITWKSDGEVFAVNYCEENRRVIKIFDNQCQPLFENRSVNGLQPILAWRPFGAALASICIVKNEIFLVLFEKNATVRHEFKLEHNLCVEELKWDQSGNYLAAYLKNEENSSQIRIYIIKNYHLYLKHTLLFNSMLINFKWNLSSSFSSYLLANSPDSALQYRFRVNVNKMYNYLFDCTVIGVIDGHSLNLCKDTQSNCSPYKTITLYEPINSVVFCEMNNTICLFGVNNLYFYKYENIEKDPVFIKKVHLKIQYFYPHMVYNSTKLCFYDSNLQVYEIDVDNDVNGLLKVDTKCNLFMNEHDVFSELVETNTNPIKLTLNDYKQFYLNSKLIWTNITSYTIHKKYLFLTTAENLIGIRLVDLEKHFNSKKIDPYTRTIDFGSVLISGMGSTSNLILQAPRGNIEFISCLLINIDNVNEFLKDNKWKEAWNIVRLLKVNSNVLFDLCPERFFNNILKFVEESSLTIFLSELKEENIFDKVYNKFGYKTEKYQNKVETVCAKLIDCLVENYFVEELSAIVHACLIMNDGIAGVKLALQYVELLFRQEQLNDEIKTSVQNAIKFLLKYVHVREAYQAALSIYNLELAILIARNSGMDPKEYIDYMVKLKNLSEFEQKFTINDTLGYHDVAIFYLHESEKINSGNVLNYMEKHNLQKVLYENVGKNDLIYDDVVKSYAEVLIRDKSYEEAAMILERAKIYDEALGCFIKAGIWKKSIEMMKLLNYDEVKFKRNVREIALQLVSLNKEIDASYLYETYLGDYENAIIILTDKNHFDLAYEMAKKHLRMDIIETNIIPTLQEFLKQTCCEIEQLKMNYIKYKERLSQLRNEKIEKLKNLNENLNTDNMDDFENGYGPALEDDLRSLAGSMVSTKYGSTTSRSSRSTTSSRSTKKQQKKIEDLRKGGQYEDIALMKVLHETITSACNLGLLVRKLCVLFFELNSLDNAKLLHSSLYDLQNRMKKDIKEIWPDTLLKQSDPDNSETKVLQENMFYLDADYWKPPLIKFDWALKILMTS